MDTYSEEIWKDRVKKKVKVDKISDLKSFEQELKDMDTTSFGIDYSKQRDILLKHSEKFIKGSQSLQQDMFENMSEKVLSLSDTYDFEGIKKLEPFNIKEQEYRDNVAFNTARSRVRELKDTIDIRGLQTFKGYIKGRIKYDDEIISVIDQTIERLLKEQGR